MTHIQHWLAVWKWWWSMPTYDFDARQWWKTETALWAQRRPVDMD